MSISLISCVDETYAIGYQNKLLAHMPSDLTRFKQLTLNKNCVMGRKTYESIIDINGKPLLNRNTIILTENELYKPPHRDDNVIVQHDIATLLSILKLANASSISPTETMICGGSTIYEQFLPHADTIYLTKIHHKFINADSFFPKLLRSEWKVVSLERHLADEKNPYDYSFIIYKRNN